MMHKAWRGALLFCKVIGQISRSHGSKNRRIWPKLGVSGQQLQFEFTDGYEMLHKAWNSKGEVPYFFPRSSIKFQGHTGQNITDFDPNWAFMDYRLVAAFKSLRFALFFHGSFGFSIYFARRTDQILSISIWVLWAHEKYLLSVIYLSTKILISPSGVLKLVRQTYTVRVWACSTTGIKTNMKTVVL